VSFGLLFILRADREPVSLSPDCNSEDAKLLPRRLALAHVEISAGRKDSQAVVGKKLPSEKVPLVDLSLGFIFIKYLPTPSRPMADAHCTNESSRDDDVDD